MKVMRISDWLAAAMKLSIIAAFVILLSACSNTVKVEHVEAFSIEIFSEKNKDGFYEQAGFKKVNSITALAENKNYTSSETKMVVDYYDLDGKYVKSEIVHSKFSKSHITMVEDGDDRKKELQEPSTIIIPDDNLQNFRPSALSDDDKKQIKQHILNLIDKL